MSALRKKIRTALIELFKLPGIILAVPFVLIVRLIRPLILIRFGPLRSGIIGHGVFDPEYYLCERELEKVRSIDCFYFETPYHVNEQWAMMLKRNLRVNFVFQYIDRANSLIPGGEVHHKKSSDTASRDIKGYLYKTEPHFDFTFEEKNKGLQFLKEIGMHPSSPFVCMIIRDSAYKEKLNNNKDWSYHSYRDTDIDTYEDAALALAEKGYWVFRMGKVVHKPFKADHSQILDYACSKYRSNFLDIWLMANCTFCISTGTGLDSVSMIFRRPVVYVNFLPVSHIVFFGHCITVPKHLFWQETNKHLTLSEYLVHSYLQTEKYEKAKILVKNLSAKEIRQAVLEMDARLAGTWIDKPEDELLQDRFREILRARPDFLKYHGWIHPEASVGAEWLRNRGE
jgi:putative glycosyltransferase (TIGR04372 family)